MSRTRYVIAVIIALSSYQKNKTKTGINPTISGNTMTTKYYGRNYALQYTVVFNEKLYLVIFHFYFIAIKTRQGKNVTCDMSHLTHYK